MPKGNLTRRDVLKSLAAAPGALALSRLASAAETDVNKPNVIYILADDLGYGDIEPFGQDKIRTPSLDRMAAEGMRLTQHYSGSTVCAPSRCALMTGRHMGHAAIRSNGAGPLPADEVTVAEVMKQAGYATGAAGKWGLGGSGSTGDPNKQGFDHFFGFHSQGRAHRYYPEWVWRNDQKVPLPGNQGMTGETYVHDLFTQESLEFIRRHREEPFFWYLPYTIPHADVTVPEDSLQEYLGKFPEKPHETERQYYVDQPTPNAARAGMITRMDRDIGRILALLGELGIAERTLVIFTSDNGPCPAGGQNPGFFNSTGPLSGMKRSLKEGGIRVPTIAWWPGRVPAGSESDHVSAFWDLLPTCAELVGVRPPEGIDGLSMLPALLGNEEAQPKHEYLYWEFRDQQAVRMGEWKAIREGEGPIQLYHLPDDIAERNDVAEANPQILARAREILQQASG